MTGRPSLEAPTPTGVGGWEVRRAGVALGVYAPTLEAAEVAITTLIADRWPGGRHPDRERELWTATRR